MIRSLKQAWNDPVTRWEFRFLESQHRKPRRWWLALVALPGITAAVIAFGYLTPFTDMWVFGLITTLILLYLVGAVVTVSLSAAALAKSDPSVMGEHLILTSVTARRLAFARVIALWRHHRRLWLLLLVLHGALAYGTMITLIEYPVYFMPTSGRAFNYFAPMSELRILIALDTGNALCGSPNGCYSISWIPFKGTRHDSYMFAPAPLLILTAADSLLICAGAALMSWVLYRLPVLVILTSVMHRLLIAVLAFGMMDGAPRIRDGLFRVFVGAQASAGAAVHWYQYERHDAIGAVYFWISGYIHKTPRELQMFRHLLSWYATANVSDSNVKLLNPTVPINPHRLIADAVQLSASGLIDGAFPIANMIRPEDSARYVVFAMFTVAGSAILYLILIGTQMRIAVWILRRRGVLA